MYFDRILELNYEQTSNLTDFVSILKRLQMSIIKNDVEGIEIAVAQQEKVLHRIKNCEDNRTETVNLAINHYEIEVDKSESLDKLADMLLALNPEVYNEFNQSRAILLEKVKEVLLINQQNEIIIINSRKFIRDLIKNIIGLKKENFLDRKV